MSGSKGRTYSHFVSATLNDEELPANAPGYFQNTDNQRTLLNSIGKSLGVKEVYVLSAIRLERCLI